MEFLTTAKAGVTAFDIDSATRLRPDWLVLVFEVRDMQNTYQPKPGSGNRPDMQGRQRSKRR